VSLIVVPSVYECLGRAIDSLLIIMLASEETEEAPMRGNVSVWLSGVERAPTRLNGVG
jgi:hypothetical protein